MRLIVVILLLLGIPGWGGQQAALAEETLNIVTFDNYPPYLSSTLPGGGMGVELVKAANLAAGLQTNVAYYPPKRAQSIFLESSNSAYIGLLSHFSEDDQQGLVSVPVLPLEVGLFYYLPIHPNGIPFEQLEDLQPYLVGTTPGATSSKILRAAQVTVEESILTGLFKKLAAGRIDLCAVLDLHGLNVIDTLFPEQANNFRQLERPLYTAVGSLIVHRNAPGSKEITRRFAKGIATIKENGTYLGILETHYGKGKVPEFNQQFITAE